MRAFSIGILLILIFQFYSLHAQPQLSPKAQIRIVTCGPYQGELYSAFGHSAIHVRDMENKIDLVFNYGVFDFNQPNFYLNFTRGHLLYSLAVSSYYDFSEPYVDDNRFIHEQVLDLDQNQKQAVFEYLLWNAQPQNRDYLYDYFYDNCATRVRDVLVEVLGDDIQFDSNYVEESYTVRELCDQYLTKQPWGDLGIDLCLGLPMDKNMEPYEYMFLPDYVERGFNQVKIRGYGDWKPIVSETIVSYEPREQAEHKTLWRPAILFWILCLLGMVITFFGVKYRQHRKFIDMVLFSVTGLIGWLLLLLWLFTDHKAAARNMNLIWALPFHFPIVLILSFHNKRLFGYYFRVVALIYVVLIISWAFLPQNLHYSLFPLVLLLMVRASFIQYHYLMRSEPS